MEQEADCTMDEEQLQEIRDNLLKMREEVLADAEKAYEASQSLGKDGVPDIGYVIEQL